MIKKISVVLFMFFSISAFSQDLANNQFFGHIITSKGKTKEGVIELKHHKLPWNRQESILFFDKDLLGEKKVKKKDKESYDPKDIQGYSIMTDDGEVKYKTISYTNLSGASEADASKIGALNTLSVMSSNLSKSKHFAEVIFEGESYSIYKFFNSPAGFSISSGEGTEELERIRHNAMVYYDVLIDHEKFKKAKEYKSISVKKLFGDCKDFMKKFENGEYTRKPTKGLLSAMKNDMVEGEEMKESAIELISAYESMCK